MPTRAAQSEDASQAMILGELRGQVRELVHSVNGLSGKFDGLTREVIALGPLAVQIAKLETDVQKLKEAAFQEAGAKNLISWCLQSPLVGWIAAGILAFLALWKKP
jgi:hypothetical protein